MTPLGGDIADYQAGRNRRVQVTRRGWNRFDQAKKKTFLKWFAATANAHESARRAGVGYSTVFDHRMDDARFSEAWDRALDQGYARLEAKNLEMQFEQAAGPPLEFDGAFEPPESRLADPVMAMQLLKQHKAEVARIRAERAQRDDPPRRGRVKQVPIHERERLASDAEMQRALVRSLKAFGVRVTKGDLAPPQPGHSREGGNPAGSDEAE
jgi:hypothetical protein